MGQYYPRCAVSGVVLTDAVGVVLIANTRGNRWDPLTLPLWGSYDTFGCLEKIESDANSKAIPLGFHACVSNGLVVVDPAALRERGDPPLDSVEGIVTLFARSEVEPARRVWFGKIALAYTFVSSEIARCLTGAGSSSSLDFEREPTRSIYPPKVRRWLDSELRSFGILDASITALGGWTPPEMGQFSVGEQVLFIAQARQRFRSQPQVIEVLRRFESKALEDEG